MNRENVFDKRMVKREVPRDCYLPDLSSSDAIDLVKMVEAYNDAINRFGPSVYLEVEWDYDSCTWTYYYMDLENEKEYNSRIAAYHKDVERRKKKLEQKKLDAQKRKEEAESMLHKLAEEQGYELVKK